MNKKINEFAIAMSELLYTMRIEDSFFYELSTPNTDVLVPEDFKDKIINDDIHIKNMKSLIKKYIVTYLTNYPDNYKDDKGEYEYQPDIYDFSLHIDSYIEQLYENLHCTKTLWVCPDCGSDNVQFKVWTDANTMKVINDECPTEDSDCYCKDCECTNVLMGKIMMPKAKVIGFQVNAIDGIGKSFMHPEMKASFCVYNLEQANKMLFSTENDGFAYAELVTIWSDDIEEPTMMFEGDPRECTE